MIVLLGSTHTAFLVPILVGFQVLNVSWIWGAYIALIAGACHSQTGHVVLLLDSARTAFLVPICLRPQLDTRCPR